MRYASITLRAQRLRSISLCGVLVTLRVDYWTLTNTLRG